MRFVTLLLHFVLFAANACAQAEPSVLADKNIRNSFDVVSLRNKMTKLPGGEFSPTEDRARVRILKNSLEKEFLWHAEIMFQLLTPDFTGLKSRVVVFRHRGNSVFMLEAAQGHSVSRDMTQTIILAEFPIISQTNEAIDIDFDAGLSEVYLAADWNASDFSGSAYLGDSMFDSLAVKNSYIESAKINNKNQLVIVQNAVITLAPFGFASMNISVETRNYFSPYAPNAHFTPVETVDFDRMGFFEVAPLLLEGSIEKIYASRFDPAQDKKIVFAISANTPAEYKNAVRDGILYWNKAFGYEKIQVIDAPAGRSAPDSEYNIVQWVNWDSAGFAYADAQMDPRTGEIRHAQVFMTSAFAFSSKTRARYLLKELATAEKTHKKDAKKITLSLAGLQPSKLCDRENHQHLQNLLVDLTETNLTDAQILEISRDYIREVVAHEIGHTLGLRHNFAGNLGSNFEISELDGLFKQYLKDLSLKENIIYSSSVMEYQNFASSVLSGRLLLNSSEALPYDQKAIDVLYKGAELNPAEVPVFCTDSHFQSVIGCTVWDQGPSPLANAIYEAQSNEKSLPRNLLETIIRAKTMPFGLKSKSVEEIRLSPDTVAQKLLADQTFVTSLLVREVRELRTIRSFSKIDGLNKKAVEEKNIAYAQAEINKFGGFETLLARPSNNMAADWIVSFNNLIDSPAYKSGIGYNGEPYAFTESEVASAKALARDYFNAIQNELPKADVKSFEKIEGTLADNETVDKFADILMDRMVEYINAESGQKIEENVTLGDNKTAALTLPIFAYEQDVRLAAASLLVGKSSVATDWGLLQHNHAKNTWETRIKDLLQGEEIKAVRLDKNSRRVNKWLIENRDISDVLRLRDN